MNLQSSGIAEAPTGVPTIPIEIASALFSAVTFWERIEIDRTRKIPSENPKMAIPTERAVSVLAR